MNEPRSSVDPRLRVAFLLGCGLGVFALPRGLPVAVAVVTLAVSWLIVGLPPRRLVRQFTKLWLFALFVVGSYALFEDDPRTDAWRALALPVGVALRVNVGGLLHGLDMLGRLLTVVMASQVARAGASRAIAAGLARLHVPRVVALSLDVVLELMAAEGGGGGGGRGRGGSEAVFPASGERAAATVDGRFSLVRMLRNLAAGDVAPLAARLDRQIARAEAHASRVDVEDGKSDANLRRDVAVIAGVSATMLALKAVKLLPNIPFAPGYKLVVLTPLYVVAAMLTRSRFGATLTGLTMGTVAFLMGDGRYGLFEIGKHLAPGLLCDAAVPWMLGEGKEPGRLAYTLLGGLIGVGRVATVFGVTLALSPPAIAYAGLVPNLIFQVTFGALSGYVSAHLVRIVRRERIDGPQQPERGERATLPEEAQP